MAYARENKPFAKALTKKSYQFGAPIKLLLAGFIPAVIVGVVTQYVWYIIAFALVGVAWWVWVTMQFQKDQLFFSYLIDSLREPSHLEP